MIIACMERLIFDANRVDTDETRFCICLPRYQILWENTSEAETSAHECDTPKTVDHADYIASKGCSCDVPML